MSARKFLESPQWQAAKTAIYIAVMSILFGCIIVGALMLYFAWIDKPIPPSPGRVLMGLELKEHKRLMRKHGIENTRIVEINKPCDLYYVNGEPRRFI